MNGYRVFLLGVLVSGTLAEGTEERLDGLSLESDRALQLVPKRQESACAVAGDEAVLHCPNGYVSSGKTHQYYKVAAGDESVCVTVLMDLCECAHRKAGDVNCPSGCADTIFEYDQRGIPKNWKEDKSGIFKAVYKSWAHETPSKALSVAVLQNFREEYSKFIQKRSAELALVVKQQGKCDNGIAQLQSLANTQLEMLDVTKRGRKKKKKKSKNTSQQAPEQATQQKQKEQCGKTCRTPYASDDCKNCHIYGIMHKDHIAGSECWTDCSINNPLVQKWFAEVSSYVSFSRKPSKNNRRKILLYHKPDHLSNKEEAKAASAEVFDLLQKHFQDNFSRHANLQIVKCVDGKGGGNPPTKCGAEGGSKLWLTFKALKEGSSGKNAPTENYECQATLTQQFSLPLDPCNPKCSPDDNQGRGKMCEPLLSASIRGKRLRKGDGNTFNQGFGLSDDQIEERPQCAPTLAIIETQIRQVMNKWRSKKAEHILQQCN